MTDTDFNFYVPDWRNAKQVEAYYKRAAQLMAGRPEEYKRRFLAGVKLQERLSQQRKAPIERKRTFRARHWRFRRRRRFAVMARGF